MSDFSVYTKEEQLENLEERAVDHEDLEDHLFTVLDNLKHNIIGCLEKAFEFTMQGKRIKFTTDSKSTIKK